MERQLRAFEFFFVSLQNWAPLLHRENGHERLLITSGDANERTNERTNA